MRTIEDAPAGIRGAHAPGMKVLGLASTYSHSELQEADGIVERLSKINVRTHFDGRMRVSISK
jgi:beta-phosphoglucomutase-like phosphatase (HAD superfamily)